MGFFGPSIFAAVSPAAVPVPCHLSFPLPPPAPRPARRLPCPPPPLAALPLELVVCIIEHAAFSDGHADDTLLRHCALVCRTWSLCAQKLLFAGVSLCSLPACDAFLAATDTGSARGRILAASVVRLRAVVDHNQPDGLLPHSLALAVSRCAHLRELSLALYGHAPPDSATRTRRAAPSFDAATLALLAAGPRIASLAFTNWTSNPHTLAQLLGAWPTLRALDIGGTTPPEVPDPTTQALPFAYPGALAELRLNFQTAPSLAFMHWLTHGAARRASLRVLEFAREPPADVLQALVDAHAGALEALRLPACVLPEHVRAVRACVGLREVVVEGAGVLPGAWRAVPGTVGHVALGVDVNTVLQPLVDLVRARGGEVLRVVTVYVMGAGAGAGERHALFGVLKMVSLSSVVSNLVRASMGTSVSSTVTDEDLDRHVAELILKEAKKKAEKYGTQGIRAFLPGEGGAACSLDGRSDSPAPRTNKRFLSSIIKTTEDHNKTVLRAQALAAQEQKRERDEQERRARRRRAEEAAEAERMRRGRGRRHGRGREDSWERWEGRREGRERRTRDWERDWREETGGEGEGKRERERHEGRSRRDGERSREERSKRRSREEAGETRTREESSKSRREHRRPRYALDDIDSDSPRHRSRSRSPVPSDVESEREPPRPKSKRKRATPSPSRSRSRSRSPAPKSSHKHKHKHKRTKPPTAASSHTAHSTSPRPPSSSPPPLPSGPPPPPPPPGPPPPPPPARRLPSKMDKYFEESYDPRLDVAPLAVPSVPKTGLISDAEYAGWDAMLELLRVRREDKEEKKRLERLGVGIVSDKGLPPPMVKRTPGDAEVSVMEIQYKKRGSVREWDLGKEGML
ncbi:hypothetical protein C0992_005471 [Termitomyces sp. T32_za158]|nr:hypothetical protein C0992_005471 [Termitomyces sp. T32_za158]